jgi:spermidine/putrescine-binding protein
VLDAFTAATGIQIELLSSDTTELVNRLKATHAGSLELGAWKLANSP